MTPPQEKDRLERLQKNLYSRVERPSLNEVPSELHHESISVPSEWQDEEGEDIKNLPHRKKTSALSKSILIFSLFFFCAATAFAFYIYYHGTNVFSPNNIDIAVLGPVGAAGGEEIPLEITVTNGNSASLQSANLKIEYPLGSHDPLDVTREKKREEIPLGDLVSGSRTTRKTSVAIFGEEKSVKKISIVLEYRVKNSSAIYQKIKEFEVALTSSPVTLKVDSLKEINSGQNIEFHVSLISNSAETLSDLLLKGEYGFGFAFHGSSPKPTYGQNIWNIGSLKPGEQKDIILKGTIEGQNGEERTFRFSLGLQSKANEKEIDPVFLSAVHSVDIKKPFIAMNLLLNGRDDAIYATNFGRDIEANINLQNDVSASVANIEVEAKLSGKFDPSSVKVTRGFYRSRDNTIIWNQSTNPELALLNPKGIGRLEFSFTPIDPSPSEIASLKNPEVSISVTLKGERREESQVPQEITLSANKKVRIDSNLSLNAGSLFYEGPFKNTGPIPPKADEETTYTVVWSVYNNTNDVRDATVFASLPPYVKWLDIVSPPTEKITYNPSLGVITWNVGELKARGGNLPARQVSFQLSMTPSVNQVGVEPELLSGLTATGIDRFTETSLKQTAENVTTRFSNDEKFRSGDEIVEK